MASAVTPSGTPPLRSCYIFVQYSSPLSSLRESELLVEFESKDDEAKIEAMKWVISQSSVGEFYPKIMMAIIKFCLNSPNHLLKKLLMIYWETVEKKTKDGQILSE